MVVDLAVEVWKAVALEVEELAGGVGGGGGRWRCRWWG